jgi:hypothetical protein
VRPLRQLHLGDRQLIGEVALPTVDALHDFVTTAPWLAKVTALDASLIIGTLKRGGLFAVAGDH